jgi:hypothetical protein
MAGLVPAERPLGARAGTHDSRSAKRAQTPEHTVEPTGLVGPGSRSLRSLGRDDRPRDNVHHPSRASRTARREMRDHGAVRSRNPM